TGLQGMFDAAGWQVLTVKYGRLLEELFTRPGGAALRQRIDDMSNPESQRLLRCSSLPTRWVGAAPQPARSWPRWSPGWTTRRCTPPCATSAGTTWTRSVRR